MRTAGTFKAYGFAESSMCFAIWVSHRSLWGFYGDPVTPHIPGEKRSCS